MPDNATLANGGNDGSGQGTSRSAKSSGYAARLVGQEREEQVANLVKGSTSGEEVVVKALGSTDIDVVAARSSNSSSSSSVTKNQAAAFPLVENQGAVIVGKGKPGFEGGTVIPPTKVEIARPPSK